MGDQQKGWLGPQVISCPSCGVRLFRVDHSPFADDWLLYCNACPQAVEVSFYDPVARKVLARLSPTECSTWEGKMEALCAFLKSCSCGGRFDAHASRRCFDCNAAVIAGETVDLSIFTGCEDDPDRDATDTEQKQYDDWRSAFVRTSGLWDPKVSLLD